MKGLLECVFDGGKKSKSKAKSVMSKKSTKKSKNTKKATTSYCYKCSAMTADKMPTLNGNVRDSSCGKCSSRRSVFTQ